MAAAKVLVRRPARQRGLLHRTGPPCGRSSGVLDLLPAGPL